MSYNGLTILLEKPSRHDHDRLLSGDAGAFVRAAFSSVDLEDSSIEDAKHYRRPLPRTKVILHLGDTKLLPKGVNLFQQRGAPWVEDGIINIASFFPQDAIDRRNYFSDDEDEEDKGGDEKSTKGVTQRKNWRFWLKVDCQKTARLVKDGLHVNSCEHIIMPMFEQAMGALAKGGPELFLDIETDSKLRLTCFGFSWDASKVYSVPMLGPSGDYFYSQLETAKLLRALAVAMGKSEVVIHNASFDLLVLFWRYGLPIPKRCFDTLLAHHRCYPEVEKSLGHCLSLYTDQPYHKNEGVFEPKSSMQFQQLMTYNAKDVESLALLKPEIEQNALKLGASESVKQACESLRPYITATCEGLCFDGSKVKGLLEHNVKKILQLERCLEVMVGHPLNSSSPKQVADYLYKEMEYEETESSTDKQALYQALLRYDNPVIKFILAVRNLKKEAGVLKFTPLPSRTFAKPPDPRMTCAWVISGTETFRLASRKLLKVWGTNSQNWKKKLRKLIIPPEGMKFLQIDQAGAEALIVAFLCKDGPYRALFKAGVKIHVYVALRLFQNQFQAELGYSLQDFIDAPVEEMVKLTKWPEVSSVIAASDNWPGKKRYYFMAKKTCHSANYDIKWPTFRLSLLKETEGALVLSTEEAKGFLGGYRGMFKEIPAWHLETQFEVKATRVLRNLFGFPRYFSGPLDDTTFKKAYAFKPQSTVGTITNIAFTETFKLLEEDKEWEDCSIVQNNHDSILLQGPEEKLKKLDPLVSRFLNCKLVSPRGEEFSMKSSSTITDSWGE